MSLAANPQSINTDPLWGREDDIKIHDLLGNEGGVIHELGITNLRIASNSGERGRNKVQNTVVCYGNGITIETDMIHNTGSSYLGGAALNTTQMVIVLNLFTDLHNRLHVAQTTTPFWVRLEGEHTPSQLMHVRPQGGGVISIDSQLINIFPAIGDALGISKQVILDRSLMTTTRGPDELAFTIYHNLEYSQAEIEAILSDDNLTQRIKRICKDQLKATIGHIASLGAPITDELKYEAAIIHAAQRRIWGLADDMVYLAPKHGDLHWIQVPNWPVPREV